MPTPLPPPKTRASTARSLADIAFNAALLVSALVLTFIVLQREEDYAIPQTKPPSVQLTTMASD